MGFGLAFLPIYICEDLKLIEKDAKAAGLDVKASFPRMMGAVEVSEALVSDDIDIGPFGTAPLLSAWAGAKETPNQVFAVSGLTSLPLTLFTNQPDEQSLADLKPADHIAVPTLTSPQIYVLQLQSEKSFGQFDRLRGQTVALSNGEAMSALFATRRSGDGLFRVAAVHRARAARRQCASAVALGRHHGRQIFVPDPRCDQSLYRARAENTADVAQAIDEAARIIRDNPHRAAQIYLTHEPSDDLDGAAMDAVMHDIKDEFGSPVYGVQTMADFLSRHDQLKSAPKSWKDIVVPALLNSPST